MASKKPGKWSFRGPFFVQIGLVVVCLLLTLTAVFYLPQRIIDRRNLLLNPKDRLDAEAALRTSFIQLIGGLVVVAGLYFTARGFRLTREGHITDRYAKGIEQLGSENLDVRVGGIYALERIARDSVSDRAAIIDVLATFAREHTKEGYRAPSMQKVNSDVQAALTVIGRRPGVHDERSALDFYFCGLNDADLSAGHFENAMFYYSRLEDTSFASAKLDGAGLSFCDATRAAFTGCQARGAHFVNARYVNGWFLHADLTGADFYGCDLSGSDFGRRYSELGDPPFPPAILTNARFTKAKLAGTILRGVDLSTVTGLTREQLSEAIIDENTKLPVSWGEAGENG
jgi:uncharacterized protein YjbI with pentapeptide repeats